MGNKTIQHINTYESYHFRNATDALANNSEDEVQAAPQLEAARRQSRTLSKSNQIHHLPLPSERPEAPAAFNRLRNRKRFRGRKATARTENKLSKSKRSDNHCLIVSRVVTVRTEEGRRHYPAKRMETTRW